MQGISLGNVVSLLVLLFALSASAAVGEPDPETVLPAVAPPCRPDPNEAPLALLSRVPLVGREGAARIGEARRLAAILAESEVAAILGVPECPPELRVSATAPASLALRERAERTEAGWRLTECFEGRSSRFGGFLIVEKDPGEPRVLDFVAWSLVRDWEEKGTRAVAGDISVRLGSGLLVGTGESFGAPADFSPDESSRLAPYRSRAESAAHRGIAFRRARPSGALLLLLTSTKRDARIDEGGLVSSIDDSGLHRDSRERSRKDRLGEKIAALRWERGRGAFRAGWTSAAAVFDPAWGGGDLCRKPKAFRGDRLLASSIDLRAERGGTLLSGEIAGSSTGGAAGQLFVRRALGPVRGLLRFRNFSGRFHAPRSTVYHRLGGEPCGEIGLLALASSPVGGGATLTVRGHRYASFDRTFTSEAPVAGAEWAAWVDRDGRGPSLTIEVSGASRRETRRGCRVDGESLALSGSVSVARGRAGIRIDLKGAETRAPGRTEPKTGAGASVLATFRRGPGETVSLSLTHLFVGGRALVFPSPDLPGAFAFATLGGGYGKAGIRFAWKGFLAPPWEAALVLGPGRAGFELGLGTSRPDRR